MKLKITMCLNRTLYQSDAVIDARNMPLVPDQCFDLIINKGICM